MDLQRGVLIQASGRLAGTKKAAVRIPIEDWLRGPLRHMFCDTVLAPGLPVGDRIDQSLAGRLFRLHESGVSRMGGVVWSLLALALWSDRYLHSFHLNPGHP
jgi:hypothetical protein